MAFRVQAAQRALPACLPGRGVGGWLAGWLALWLAWQYNLLHHAGEFSSLRKEKSVGAGGSWPVC
jgi:hypothetical protein